MNKQNYTDINARTIDSWVEGGWEWGKPVSHQTYAQAAQGRWDVLLTPLKPVPKEWFAPFYKDGKLNGVHILGLASGGGQQMPIFAAAGARCTVLDYSEKQLQNEKDVAEREGYSIEIVRADMTKRLPFADNSFDLIFHPVSNCYVEDVQHVWDEAFRVLKPGGVLLSGLDNGINYLVNEDDPLRIVNRLPYNPLKNEKLYEEAVRTNSGVQFSHTAQEQIGGQLKAGFCLTALLDDSDTSELGGYCPLFWATRAVKPQ